ncbi:MAG: phosphorylase [Proteobacteria bacterium]|nr:phosphorylase [Pseudomonadota bacterium]
MIIAVTGLERERRIVAGPGVEAIAGGGDKAGLDSSLEARAARTHGIISIGIAGGLAPALRTGDWVLADGVLADGKVMSTDASWTTRLATRLPEAARGLMLGVDAIVAASGEKAELHRSTGALAVDMESHIAARVAQRHRLPFAAARVVCDPAHRTLPPAARVAMKPDGRVDLLSVMYSLLTHPAQLPALIQTGRDAKQAFGSLLRGQRRLGPGLCGPDLGQLALDVT